jgi:kinesin family protein 18/19
VCDLSFRDIFDHISKEKEHNSPIEYTVKCSFLEIYNEALKDLLTPKGPALRVRETPKGVWVENLTQEVQDQ